MAMALDKHTDVFGAQLLGRTSLMRASFDHMVMLDTH